MADWSGVSREHILSAIAKYNSENPKHPDARFTFLEYEGQKYPAKHVRGMSYELAYGRKISKQEFTGGMETVRFFTRRGFDVYYKGELISGQSSKTQKHSPSGDALSTESVNLSTELEKPVTVQEQTDELENADDVADVNHKENRKDSDTQTVSPLLSATRGKKMQSRGVIEQKNALQLLLNRCFNGDVVCEKTFDWMKTPVKIEGPYIPVYETLCNYRGDTAFAKKNVTLRCDFVIEGHKLIIEYDERQHFSEARGRSLQAYGSFPLWYDRQLWLEACESIKAKDNQPVNRDEIRAYYDSVRDIAAAMNGYKLVRIMHGQVDFAAPDGYEKLLKLLNDAYKLSNSQEMLLNPTKNQSCDNTTTTRNTGLKVGLYLQTDEVRNPKDFKEAMALAEGSDVDIIVFPEDCYTPFIENIWKGDILDGHDVDQMIESCLSLSRDIGKPVIIGAADKYNTLFNIYANNNAEEDDTLTAIYVKHTMTVFSAFDFVDYTKSLETSFPIIKLKSHKIGMTICYDCNHPMFSRVYGIQGVDIIINNTGGDVIFDKWYKYNQVRSIENHCYSFVTMGGTGTAAKPKCFVYGFSPRGKELSPVSCLGGTDTPRHNAPGAIYIYDIGTDDGNSGVDISYNQAASTSENGSFPIPVNDTQSVLEKADVVDKNLYVLKRMGESLIFCIVDGDDIFIPEKYLPAMYSSKLKQYKNKKYIIINRYPCVTEKLMREKLSVVLKVRSMESYCAVILVTDTSSICYQCGNTRTAQVVEPVNGNFLLDLKRMGGPETIWRDKKGQMKSSWRDNVE